MKLKYLLANFYIQRKHWYIDRIYKIKSNSNLLYEGFTRGFSSPSKTKRVICLFEGKFLQGGLADRLRGIISTYMICKELHVEFKLLFVHPFNLNDYFIPNTINWLIDSKSIKRDYTTTDVLYLDCLDGSDYESNKQYQWLKKKILHGKNEIIVYTNSKISYSYNFHDLFNELFKPSEKLQKSINSIRTALGESYISVSCRFLNLMGDFNETFQSEILSEEEKLQYLKYVQSEIERIHNKNPNQKILLNSDSVTFLDYMKCHDWIFIIPGKITHIDNDASEDYYTYEKTFLDYMSIAGASHIYLIKYGKMMNSGYPLSASKVGNVPFDILEIQ